jgi:hypothetical protein
MLALMPTPLKAKQGKAKQSKAKQSKSKAKQSKAKQASNLPPMLYLGFNACLHCNALSSFQRSICGKIQTTALSE